MKPRSRASLAASTMYCGVPKSGSPAPKPITEIPSSFIFLALAVISSVSEGEISFALLDRTFLAVVNISQYFLWQLPCPYPRPFRAKSQTKAASHQSAASAPQAAGLKKLSMLRARSYRLPLAVLFHDTTKWLFAQVFASAFSLMIFLCIR